MTDHKFTVDDVIKALECLSGAEIFCRECAFGRLEDHGFACKKNVANAALALVNCQKVEIESLKIANEKMYAANKEQEAEIERLQAVHADMTESLRLAAEANKDMSVELDAMRGAANSYKMHYETARTEAIKEFAEKLIDKCTDPYWCVWMSEIDDLATEMTEDKR